MNRVISCWALAEKRAKHLCAFETLGFNSRCRKPSQEEVKKVWQRLCARLHPDRNVDCSQLATEAMRCVNLAKQHLFDVHFGGAAARVAFKHEPDREKAQAEEVEKVEAAKQAAEAAEVAAAAAQHARLVAEPHLHTEPQPAAPQQEHPPPATSGKRPAPAELAEEEDSRRQRFNGGS
uniref:J domain-containing protein n=1 Tax=Prymnesium polylepis TaxID=72548 RepID=A0A7S4HL98_9EUKA